ncbi:hypothetical protein PanWU01x14_226140 [Parasponia andersonii]|uniref:Uncharacterized protein n=1 Tax=Parasponia andersonii TaxID=3476 RepID=A0A2P5BMF4_PARAD|nr:hypothetical protein PanWU01x14_226140 [Parasponia andersonii]
MILNMVPSYNVLVRLEEADLDTSVDDNIESSRDQNATETHPQDSKRPVEAPYGAVLLRLLDLVPHEARVRQCNRQCYPSNETRQAAQEGNCDRDEEAAEAEHGPRYDPKPPRHWLLLPASVLGLYVVEGGHTIYVEGAQGVDNDKETGESQHKLGHIT